MVGPRRTVLARLLRARRYLSAPIRAVSPVLLLRVPPVNRRRRAPRSLRILRPRLPRGLPSKTKQERKKRKKKKKKNEKRRKKEMKAKKKKKKKKKRKKRRRTKKKQKIWFDPQPNNDGLRSFLMLFPLSFVLSCLLFILLCSYRNALPFPQYFLLLLSSFLLFFLLFFRFSARGSRGRWCLTVFGMAAWCRARKAATRRARTAAAARSRDHGSSCAGATSCCAYWLSAAAPRVRCAARAASAAAAAANGSAPRPRPRRIRRIRRVLQWPNLPLIPHSRAKTRRTKPTPASPNY